MYHVLITDSIEPPAAFEQSLLGDFASVRVLQVTHDCPLDDQVHEADALVVYHEVSVSASTIAAMPRCQVIVRGGVGYDNVDLAAASERGIPVCNIPDYGVDEVADHSIGLLLALNRGFLRVERNLRHSLTPWDRRVVEPVFRLTGSTLGVIGCGRIGSATVRRALALRMRVLVYDPYLRPGMEKALDVTRVDLDTLLAESDAITIHTPLTSETRHIINANTLSQMRRHVLLINTSRGAVVDTEAVADALENQILGGTAIDVLAHEPPDRSSALIRLWQDAGERFNLIITPHIAYYSTAAIEEIRRKGIEEIVRVLQGKSPLNCVNRRQLGFE